MTDKIISALTVTLCIVFIFQWSCRSVVKETEHAGIDIQTVPKMLTLFGEDVISTPLYERDMAISPKGDELVYTLGDYKQHKRALVGMKFRHGNWETPEILTISGQYQDIEPFFTTDGNRLYFASNRPIYNDSTRSDYNLWYSDKKEEMWAEPVALDSMINTKGDEFFPSLSTTGNLFFTATRENGVGREDIFMCKLVAGKFVTPEPLPAAINTPLYEFNAFIAPDEDYIIFSSFERDDGFGGGDLYISQKDQNGIWMKARNLGGKINSGALDFCPFVDMETGNFYFTSERMAVPDEKIEAIADLKHRANSVHNGMGNIYKIGLAELDSLKK